MAESTGGRLILLRFGELWLKSAEVQRRFKDRLLTNIGEMLRKRGIPARISASRDRILLEVYDADLSAVSGILSRTFGIVSFSPAERLDAKLQAISDAVLGLAKKTIKPGGTFAIRCQRSGNHDFTSSGIERECGARVVAALGNKVNLTSPDRTVYVDVRDNDAYVFSEKVPAPGGLPLGVEGRLVQIFGRDLKRDIVASYIMMKRGCRILPVFEKGGRSSKKALGFLECFDPLSTPYFAPKKNLDTFALELCRKKKAGGIVCSGGAMNFYGEKKAKLFDKKAKLPYLYPLVGFTGEDMGARYDTITNVLRFAHAFF